MTNIFNITPCQHYDQEMQQIFHEIEELRSRKEIATSPESVELLEQEIHQLTNKLGSLLLEEQLQNSLLASELKKKKKNLSKVYLND